MSQELATTGERLDELGALIGVASRELGAAVGGGATVHRVIADRVFAAVEAGVGRGALPARIVHHAVSGGIYGLARGATRALGAGAGAAVRLGDAGGGPAPSTTPGGSLAIGIVLGLRGDALEREQSPLVQPMAVRVDGRPVPPRREALAAAFPRATSRLVVFLHGLMETEFSWRFPGGEGGGFDDGDTYGSRLERDLGRTPVYLRYNSGRHISENGRSLAELLEAVIAEWPVDVDQIALVGHSMGGLVARSAAQCAIESDMAWVHKVRHVVSLGSPHLGAPLEEIVHVASAGLAALPETRPLANFLRRRSSGIRDLRRGSLVDEDWRDRDPDALRAAACREVPLLEGATHYFVAATITGSPRHPIGRLIGDLLVLESSASGRGRTRRVGFKTEHGMHVGGATHFALLHHPAVYERLLDWLSTPDPPYTRQRLCQDS